VTAISSLVRSHVISEIWHECSLKWSSAYSQPERHTVQHSNKARNGKEVAVASAGQHYITYKISKVPLYEIGQKCRQVISISGHMLDRII